MRMRMIHIEIGKGKVERRDKNIAKDFPSQAGAATNSASTSFPKVIADTYSLTRARAPRELNSGDAGRWNCCVALESALLHPTARGGRGAELAGSRGRCSH